MNKKTFEMLKRNLEQAIKENNVSKIKELSEYLKISEMPQKYIQQGIIGYPSIDMPWLKYYGLNSYKNARNIPKEKTVWDVIEEKLHEHYDITALEYFGRKFSSQEFIDFCYIWARTFRAMGVEKNEIVPVYGPVVPDICAMVFALNMIGACPYFLKLGIKEKGLEQETADAKIAVVFDGMWKNVQSVFSQDRFKNVIIASVSTDMPSPKKQIVSFMSKLETLKNKSGIPNEKKYIWSDKARLIADYYSGNVKVDYEKNRPVLISSSSGTTVNGGVKGAIATNESILSQIYNQANSELPYYTGDRVLNHFPFAAATSLNSLFLYPMYKGLTIVIDPRVSNKDFYNQLLNLKPNIAVSTGSSWECFFDRILNEMENGKTFDFSYAKGWSVGGEGTDVSKFDKWNQIMEKTHAHNRLFSGYGLTEAFSGISVDNVNAKPVRPKQIISVGIPEAGITVGIFNQDGKELSYNQRGELWIKTQTAMKEYYGKPELTAQTKDGEWLKTNDLAEIDENGLIYVWGRLSDTIELQNGDTIYSFDVTNTIKANDFIEDAILLNVPTETNPNNLVAHIVWNGKYSKEEKFNYIELMNQEIHTNFPIEIKISAYAEHEGMLPYADTTLKKDRNKMFNQKTGFVQVIEGIPYNIEFDLNENGLFTQKCAIISKDKKKSY